MERGKKKKERKRDKQVKVVSKEVSTTTAAHLGHDAVTEELDELVADVELLLRGSRVEEVEGEGDLLLGEVLLTGNHVEGEISVSDLLETVDDVTERVERASIRSEHVEVGVIVLESLITFSFSFVFQFFCS